MYHDVHAMQRVRSELGSTIYRALALPSSACWRQRPRNGGGGGSCGAALGSVADGVHERELLATKGCVDANAHGNGMP